MSPRVADARRRSDPGVVQPLVARAAGGEHHPGHRPRLRCARRPSRGRARRAAAGWNRPGCRSARWRCPAGAGRDDRALFFVATRGAPADEDEWWSCRLDCEPDDCRAGRRAALALPGTATCVAPPSRLTRPAGRAAGCAPGRSIRCRTRCGCSSSSPTPARSSRCCVTSRSEVRRALPARVRRHPGRGELAGPRVRRGRRHAAVHGPRATGPT